MSRGVPVRITQGIEPQHNRVAFMRAMSQFGEVVYCRKPPYSGIPGEDYVNIGFATQSAAEKAYEELKAGRVFVDGIVVGVGPTQKEGGGGGGAASFMLDEGRSSRRSRSRGAGSRRSPARGAGARGGGRREPDRQGLVRGTFKQRHDERSPSPRTIAREAMLSRKPRRSKSRKRSRSRSSRSRSRRR